MVRLLRVYRDARLLSANDPRVLLRPELLGYQQVVILRAVYLRWYPRHRLILFYGRGFVDFRRCLRNCRRFGQRYRFCY